MQVTSHSLVQNTRVVELKLGREKEKEMDPELARLYVPRGFSAGGLGTSAVVWHDCGGR